ncbi:uncharacterized protein LOC121987417 isoform X2 [Zingiber officinale]|uniref:uncharacterized protein LOC121987417 isoform X2 n=1 Tax=Zingiber officinale TaxID=94328 RepID=UPI001C4D4572|nr:uncharacterized protein LOC121987417 isoform X2 [Zingiber officinale]
MQVTRSNFNAALEGLRACVEESDFVVVDLEMTGVTSAPWRNSFEFDRSDVRYLKLKDSVEKFAVVQFGVCPFRWDSSKGSFFAHPHNFYIFPRNELPLHGPPDDFLCIMQDTKSKRCISHNNKEQMLDSKPSFNLLLDFLNKIGWFINLYKRSNLSHEIRRQGGQKEEIEGMHAISSRMEEQIIERKKNLLLHKVGRGKKIVLRKVGKEKKISRR